jgi:hypothetical protein
MLLLGGATITLLGCGGGGKDATPAPTPTPVGDRSAIIENNHGHEAKITSAQLAAGNALTLNIQATATHNHTVTLTAEEVVMVRNGTQLIKLTSTSGHAHSVQFN